jgi:hypothetical protein
MKILTLLNEPTIKRAVTAACVVFLILAISLTLFTLYRKSKSETGHSRKGFRANPPTDAGDADTLSTGTNNVIIGYRVGDADTLSTGTNNVLIGVSAGDTDTTSKERK